MNSYPIACVGATSSHNGHIISAQSTIGQIYVDGLVPGAYHAVHLCPIVGHGTPYVDPIYGPGWITDIVSSPITTVQVEGQPIAMVGSVAGCGAVINSGSLVVNAVGP